MSATGICELCGSDFSAKPKLISTGRRRFCSIPCSIEAKRHKPEDVWDRIDQSGGQDCCWEWQGGRDRRGYGMFLVRGKNWRTHRLVMAVVHGSIPDGMDVLHSCDNPPCCNPKHLRFGTQAQNMKDLSDHGRHVGYRRLTEDQVREIRQIGRTMLMREVAEIYGVHRVTISMILLRKNWKHVDA